MKRNKGIVKTSIFRIVVLLMIIGLNWSGISAIGQTLAYFNDTEISGNTSITIGTLDFSLSSPGDFSPLATPDQSANRSIDVINDGTLGFQYQVYASDFSGDMDLCNALQLAANLDEGGAEYSGSLTGFTYNAGEFVEPENWEFIVSLPSDASPDLENKTCNFKFIFNGVQLGNCAGFMDIEEIENTISSGQWAVAEEIKINKVYYDVDADHGTEPANEWVELYNASDSPVDIADWTIEDNTSSDLLSGSTLIIPAYGYAVITGSSSTWDYWSIPGDVIKIVLSDGKIGNGLANDGDRLILKNASGYEVDAMSYGTDTYAFDPACPDVDEGHMLGRVPNGYDTDQASDFKDLEPPTVSVTYYSGTWYCGSTYTINWIAINNNGDDSELLIDIIYITDNDKNGTISDGDNVYLVEEKIGNSGWYDFYIDSCKGYCYYGYVWVKIIAYGPENFMVQGSDTGPRVFEPPVPESDLNAVACPFELEYEEDVPIDVPDISPVDTTSSEEDGVEADEPADEPAIIQDPVINVPDIDPIDTTSSEEDGVEADEPADEPAIIQDPVIDVPDINPIETTTSEQDGVNNEE
ncbi:lamin tail domain-containing protein [Candidatus Parcubacteria bacterium]|nr:lamin tail domain-containing protein [Candidatus Parcubacteria bacterium]